MEPINNRELLSSDSTFFMSDIKLLLLKGDGKEYNFRVRTPNGRHSYGFTFPTKGGGKWETISTSH
jgi:hypothetical protein